MNQEQMLIFNKAFPEHRRMPTRLVLLPLKATPSYFEDRIPFNSINFWQAQPLVDCHSHHIDIGAMLVLCDLIEESWGEIGDPMMERTRKFLRFCEFAQAKRPKNREDREAFPHFDLYFCPNLFGYATDGTEEWMSFVPYAAPKEWNRGTEYNHNRSINILYPHNDALGEDRIEVRASLYLDTIRLFLVVIYQGQIWREIENDDALGTLQRYEREWLAENEPSRHAIKRNRPKKKFIPKSQK
jgi:hypothetical protein